VDIGEAVVSAAEAEGEFFVVDAHEVEDGGVEVVDVDTVFDGAATEFIFGAVGEAGFDSATGHPGGEAVVIVVTALGSFGGWGTSELPSPDDEGVFEQAA